MKIMFINNDGAGFADTIEVAEDMTIAQLFAAQLPNRKPADYFIRVHRLPSTADQVLHPGDRVSITPSKIEGATLAP